VIAPKSPQFPAVGKIVAVPRAGRVVLFQTTARTDVGCRKPMSGFGHASENPFKTTISR
jgi:hypothetical protein